jgi:membrane protease YdiL (CAAX protease family)
MTVLIFISASTAFIIVWGKVLWFFAEKSRVLTKFIFFLMSFARMSFPGIRSVILSFIYFSVGILGIVGFAGIYNLDIYEMFTFNIGFIPLIFLGIIAEISLTIFFVSIYLGTRQDRRVNVHTEIRAIPWINGIGKLPGLLLSPFLVISAFLEEFFFRGVLLLILVKKLPAAVSLPPWIALLLVTILFWIEQTVQLRTKTQVVIISCSCFAISLVGGLLVLYTGSIIPAGLSHASFVIFFFGYSGLILNPK